MDARPAEQPTRARRPGQMTAVMRAMAIAAGPKVMRVGVVQGGRVVDERIIKERAAVTVGSNEAATFVIASPLIPPLFALFERIGDDYYVNVRQGMKGRLALAAGIIDMPAGPARVKLTDEARGKVVIGDTTFLFQFVAPPPVQARPQLPLAVKGGFATRNDWALTLIAAFSFLVHFGIVGAMYSDWADPIVGDRYDVAGLVDMIGKIPPAPIEVPEQTAAMAISTTTPAPTSPTQAPKETSPTGPSARPTAAQHAQPSGGEMSNERAASLAARAETMNMQVVAGLEGGPAVKGAIDRSNIPAIDLGAAAERNVGVTRENGELKVTAGGPVHGQNSRGLSAIGGPKKAEGPVVAGKESLVAGPTAIAQVGNPTVSAAIPNVDGTVAGLRGRFRSCYQTGLLSDSTMSGKVVIAARVGPNGEVVSSDIASISGLSPSVGQCIAGVVKRATFSAPGGGGSTVNIPVTFVLSK